MNVKVAVDAKVSRDREYCLKSCPGFSHRPVEYRYHFCVRYAKVLKRGVAGKPLRCRLCLHREVRP